jgi:hypothetical protein
MSVSGISANGFPDFGSQSKVPQVQQEFLQIGNDLAAGDLTAAESDFVTLEAGLPAGTGAPLPNGDPVAQVFARLSEDLQTGNLAAAQQDYSEI